MSSVKILNPEEFIENATGKFFQIFLYDDNQIISWVGTGFQNAEIAANGFFNMKLFRKDEVVKQYYSALNMVKQSENSPYPHKGFLQIVEIPLFGS